MIKADPAKLPRIVENQGPLFLTEHEMIMFAGREISRLDAQPSAHAKVKAEPVVAGKFEKHLFSPRLGSEEGLPNDPGFERSDVGSAKGPLLAM
jgi:hypothetical protein